MKVFRKYNWVASVRKFKVIVNDEVVCNIRMREQIEINLPEGRMHEIKFKYGLLDRSKTIQVTNEDSLVVGTMGLPMYMTMTLPLLIGVTSFGIISSFSTLLAFIVALSMCILQIVVVIIISRSSIKVKKINNINHH